MGPNSYISPSRIPYNQSLMGQRTAGIYLTLNGKIPIQAENNPFCDPFSSLTPPIYLVKFLNKF